MFHSTQLVVDRGCNVADQVAVEWEAALGVQLWNGEALVRSEWVQAGRAELGRELYRGKDN